jgi:hypothetical protein
MPITPADGIYWPHTLYEQTNEWNRFAGSISGGMTFSGAMQNIVQPGGGLWSTTLNALQLMSDDQRRAFLALRTLARDGAMPIHVPRRLSFEPPWPLDGNGNPITSFGDIPNDDDSLFDDGTGYYCPVINITTYGETPINSTSMSLYPQYASALRGGESFSIWSDEQGWMHHEIGTVSVNAALGVSVVSIAPWTREAISHGTFCDFERRYCTMKLTEPKAMNMVARGPSMKDEPSVQLIEMIF